MIIIKEAKRVFKGGYEEERLQMSMPHIKKEIDALRNRWNIKDHLSLTQKEINKTRTLKMVKKRLNMSKPTKQIKLFFKSMDHDDFIVKCRYLLLVNVIRKA